MPSMLRRYGGETSRLGWPALLLMLMRLVAYTYGIARGPLSNADARVALTRAIVDDHTLRIDRYAAGLADRSAYRGHFYTDKAPGTSLLAVPVYAALRLALPPAFFGPGLSFVVRYLLTAVVLVAAMGVAPAALYNTAVYGNPFSQGYAHLHGDARFIAGMRHGAEGVGLPNPVALWGITFSPYRGLFLLSPFLLLALPGLAA